MGTLRDRTLSVVRKAAARRELLRLSAETGVSYATLHYIATADPNKVRLDVNVCERLYEFRTGKKLDLVDYV